MFGLSTEPQKLGGLYQLGPLNFLYVVWQSIIMMSDNSVLLLTPQTLLNIVVLVAQHEASLWHDRIPSHSSVLASSQYVEEHLSSREDRKIDTLLLRITTLLI